MTKVSDFSETKRLEDNLYFQIERVVDIFLNSDWINPMFTKYVEYRNINWGDTNVFSGKFAIIPSNHIIDIGDLISKDRVLDCNLIITRVKSYLEKYILEVLLTASSQIGINNLEKAIKFVIEGQSLMIERNGLYCISIKFGLGFGLEYNK